MPAAPKSPPPSPNPVASPQKKFSWTLLFLILLFIIWILTAAGFIYLFFQNRELARRVTQTPSPQALPTPTPSPAPTGKESEITSIDSEWDLYTNYNFGFSLKVPKTTYHSFGACEFKEDENSYRPKLAPIPVKIFEAPDRVYLSTQYYYELTGETVVDGTHYYSACNQVQNSLAHLQDKEVFQQQSWEMVKADVSNDSDLEAFIQDNYGSGCKVGEKSQSTQDGVLDVRIDTGGYSDLEEARAHNCLINYMYLIKYAPAQKRAITWAIGQSYTFFKDVQHAAYDEEMIASFKIIDVN